MKKIILSIVAISLLCSCAQPTVVYLNKADNEKSQLFESLDIEKVVTIEGCEYFVLKSYATDGHFITTLTHKGNCINPIHKQYGSR